MINSINENKMRKNILALALAAVSFGAVAQQPAETTATRYLPEKGDFAFGVDVLPLFKAIGGSYNDDETPGVGGTPFSPDVESSYVKPNVSLMGKYMISDRWGVKVNLGLTFSNKQKRLYAPDDLDAALSTGEAKVVDSRKTTRTGGSLMAGMEYRLGKRRVQGVFGFGALFAFTTDKVTYSYGNAMTDINQNPSTAFPDQDQTLSIPYGYRVTECNYDGPNFVAGVYGSAGAEWFVAPKIAIGATVDLYVYGAFGSKGYVKSEGYNQAYGRVEERTDLYTPGNRGFNFGTDNLGGSLYMTFYF